MGRAITLFEELQTLNKRTLQLSEADFRTAREAGPPELGSSVEMVAPFGLAVLTRVTEYAVARGVTWIMDY